jgi:NAD(P)-dependent dehydrogenase (short-subunit alcohol dehydrogenase family)
MRPDQWQAPCSGGRLDVPVNNSAAGAIMPLAETSVHRMKDIFAVNVLGPSMLATEALPRLPEPVPNNATEPHFFFTFFLYLD